MKKTIIALTFICFVFFACNSSEKKNDNLNTGDVPAAVQSAFTTKYPGATEIKWESATENDQPTYKAKFTREGKKYKAEFTKEGTFIKDKEDQ